MSLFARTLPLFSFALCAWAQNQPQPIFQKMDEAGSGFHSLTADLARTHYTKVVDEFEPSKGTLVVRRDKPKEYKYLFHVTEPAPQEVAYSGRKARTYNPKLNIISEYDIDKKMGSKFNDYLLLGFGATYKELQQSYSIKLIGIETVSGQKTTRLELTPKKSDDGADLKQAELWIANDTGIALQQKFYWLGGDYDLVTCSNMKVNPSNPPSAELRAPSNAKTEHPLK